MKPSPSSRQLKRRNRLTTTFRNLVPPIARRYAQSSPEALDDLLQVGMLGLMRAAERFSPADAIPFERFARPHIRGAILHHLRDCAWLVRLPRRQAELQHQLGRSLACDAIAMGPAAVDSDVCGHLRRWAALVRPVSLEAIGLECCSTIPAQSEAAELVHGAEGGSDYSPIGLNPDWSQLSSAQILDLLAPRQRQVLRCVVLQGWSYRRTGAHLCVSAATVQRLLHQGLAELRRRLSAPTESTQRRAPSAAAAL